MRVLKTIEARLRVCFRKQTVRGSACLLMTLLVASCVDIDGLSLPDFQHSNQSSSAQSSQDSKNNDDFVFAPVKKIKTETLLAVGGNWNLIEQDGPMDPTLAHMQARKNVDIRRRKYMKELSPHFKPDAKSGEDGRMRVLRLEPEDGAAFEDYEIAESSIAKPTHTVAEKDLLNKIKQMFGENDEDSQRFITPKRKPETAISKAAKSEGTHIALLSHKPTNSEERMVGGVIIPPNVPARKYSAVKIASANVPAAAEKVAIEQVDKTTQVLDNGLVIPDRKPARAKNAVVRPPVKVASKSASAQNKSSAAGSGGEPHSSVVRLRSGKHPGKTRLVIEVTRTTKYKVVIDHLRNVLRIKLYDTQWNLSPQENFTKSDLLGTYVARPQKDGSVILEVRMKKKTKILDTMILRPNVSAKHRVVIDLKD
tara:strand:- start:47997 stop:49268 length:1272 start_codon:yes stop_codon:yes gene_type:complete